MDEFSPDELADSDVCRWEPPKFSVIPLDCEITAYAPADGDPLF